MSPSNSVRHPLLAGIVVAFVAALVVHPLLGWAWSPVAGVAGGWIAHGRGWIAGCIGVCAAWGSFAAWSFLVDARAVSEMTRVVAGLLGGLPAPATVVLTLVAGGLLGAAGGLLGDGLRNIIRPVSR